MRRVLAALCGLALAALTIAPAAATPTPTTAASAPAPLFTCRTGAFILFNDIGDAYFNNSIDRLTISSIYTDYCEGSGTAGSHELDLIGENNCLTYAGPKTGTAPLGYVDKTTCAGHASQIWGFASNGELMNSYLGSGWCLDGPTFNGRPFMEHCNSGDGAQLWATSSI